MSARAAGPGAATLALRQVRYENRSFWRNPPAAVFTFAFPLFFLAITYVAFGGSEIEIDGVTTSTMTFYVPAIVTFSIVTACYTNVAMGIALARDRGVLKRVRGTPLPAWAWVFGRIAHATLVALLLVALTVAAGALLFGVDLRAGALPAFAVSLALGAASFAALGVAITGAVRNAEAAPAVVNATILPLLFVSDVFIRIRRPPEWLDALAGAFPVAHLQDALQAAFSPGVSGAGWRVDDLVVVALWGVAGAAVAARTFTWEPRA